MLQLCSIHACANGTLGLHLSRAPWDPYPWVSGIQDGSSAQNAGLRVGDTVLELNGCDVLGQKIVEIATRIREHWQSGATYVTLVVWRNDAVADGGEHDEAADNEHAHQERQQLQQQQQQHGINQQSLQKFATCLQHIAQLLECPVCLEVVKPPGWQCCNGHVMCNNCRSRSVKCPVCRVPLGPRGRCLLSDKLFTLLAESFPCDGVKSNSNLSKDMRKCTTDFSQCPKLVTTAEPQQIKAKEINKKVKSFGQQDGKVDKISTALVSQVGDDATVKPHAPEGHNKTQTNVVDDKMLQSTYWQQRRSRTSKVHQVANGELQSAENQRHELKMLKSCEDEQLSGGTTAAVTTTTTTESRANVNSGCNCGEAVGDVTATASRYNNVLVKLKLKSSKKSTDCSVAVAQC